MLLAIDTCGAVGGIALGDVASDPGALWFRDLAGKTFSELLLSTVVELLREADLTMSQLSGIVVVNGPGSFTGIRIGVSAAKGLAEGLGVPVIAVSRLELLARKAPGGSAAAVLDAGRGEFYTGLYRDGVREAEVLLGRDALSQAVLDFGFPVLISEERVWAALADLAEESVAPPSAVDAFKLGAERLRLGAFDDVATLDANYLRRSETEMLARIAEHASMRAAAQAISSAE